MENNLLTASAAALSLAAATAAHAGAPARTHIRLCPIAGGAELFVDGGSIET